MTDAQFKLGVLYANGQGVRKNMILADMWLILAGEKIDGNKNRKKVEKKMTPKQIAEAKRLAGEWMEKHIKK
jgi:TPR repeat protein